MGMTPNHNHQRSNRRERNNRLSCYHPGHSSSPRSIASYFFSAVRLTVGIAKVNETRTTSPEARNSV